MALTNNKMNKADTGYSNNAVSGLTENRYVGQATTLKAKFDALTGEYVIPKFNALIDTLDSAVDGSSGADNIKATPTRTNGETTVQGILEEHKTAIDAAMPKAGGTFTGTIFFVDTGAEIRRQGDLLIVSGANGLRLRTGSARVIAQNLDGSAFIGFQCLDLLLAAGIGWGGTVSIIGKSGAQDVLILQGGTANAISMRAPSVRIRNSADTDFAPCYGASFTNPSSIRYKHAIEMASDKEALDLLHINIKNYIYNEGKQDKVQIGVIAEEIDEMGVTYPITYDAEGRPDGVDYSKFVPALIKLCQMQQAQIDDLKANIETLKQRTGLI